MQRQDRVSGVPLEILEHLPTKPESAYFLLCALTYTPGPEAGSGWWAPGPEAGSGWWDRGRGPQVLRLDRGGGIGVVGSGS